MGVAVKMHDARNLAKAAAAPGGDFSRPATMDDLLTKDDVRAFAIDVERTLGLSVIFIVVSTVGLLTPLLWVLLR